MSVPNTVSMKRLHSESRFSCHDIDTFLKVLYIKMNRLNICTRVTSKPKQIARILLYALLLEQGSYTKLLNKTGVR